jgi:hypothetical protein
MLQGVVAVRAADGRDVDARLGVILAIVHVQVGETR